MLMKEALINSITWAPTAQVCQTGSPIIIILNYSRNWFEQVEDINALHEKYDAEAMLAELNGGGAGSSSWRSMTPQWLKAARAHEQQRKRQSTHTIFQEET
jgi:uncharacterized protein YecA (UPF0149 family)